MVFPDTGGRGVLGGRVGLVLPDVVDEPPDDVVDDPVAVPVVGVVVAFLELLHAATMVRPTTPTTKAVLAFTSSPRRARVAAHTRRRRMVREPPKATTAPGCGVIALV